MRTRMPTPMVISTNGRMNQPMNGMVSEAASTRLPRNVPRQASGPVSVGHNRAPMCDARPATPTRPHRSDTTVRVAARLPPAARILPAWVRMVMISTTTGSPQKKFTNRSRPAISLRRVGERPAIERIVGTESMWLVIALQERPP